MIEVMWWCRAYRGRRWGTWWVKSSTAVESPTTSTNDCSTPMPKSGSLRMSFLTTSSSTKVPYTADLHYIMTLSASIASSGAVRLSVCVCPRVLTQSDSPEVITDLKAPWMRRKLKVAYQTGAQCPDAASARFSPSVYQSTLLTETRFLSHIVQVTDRVLAQRLVSQHS